MGFYYKPGRTIVYEGKPEERKESGNGNLSSFAMSARDLFEKGRKGVIELRLPELPEERNTFDGIDEKTGLREA